MTRRVGRWRVLILSGILTAALAGGVIAEQVIKAKGPVTVFDSPDGLANVVASVDSGSSLTILDQQGDFYHVKTADGKDGFVAKSALDAGALDAGLVGGGSASEMATAGAAKGLTPEAMQYASQKNINPAAALKIESIRKNIKTQDWAIFARDGDVGVIPERLRNRAN